MFTGWMQLAGNEVINVARTMAYVEAGYVPSGLQVNACEECEHLPELLGDKPYATPLIDQAPWFESGNADSWDFAGIIPLEVTGLNGSTRAATVSEMVGDGGSVSGSRYGSRTIAYTALLVGKSTCGVEAGLAWLSQVLGGSNCTGRRPTGTSACDGDEMCVLSCCPGELSEQIIPDQIDTTQIPLYGWTAAGGFFDGTTGEFEPTVRPPGTWTNLVPNPSFEVDLTGWSATGGTTERSTDVWASRWGAASLKATASGGADMVVSGPVIPVSQAFVNMSIRIGTSLAQARVILRVRWSDGTTVDRPFEDLNSTSYTTVRASLARPTAATSAQIQIVVRAIGGAAPAAGVVAYLDAALLTQAAAAATPAYVDGDMSDTDSTTFTWNGTPHNSTTTATVAAVPVVLTGPVIECIDQAVLDFGFETVKGNVRVQPQAVDPDGTVLWTGDWVTVLGGSPNVTIIAFTDWGDWRPRLNVDPATPNPFSIDPMLAHSKYQSIEECAGALTKSYLDVTTISGPTVVEEIATSCGEKLLRVEWTMVAGNPMILGPEEPLIAGMYSETAGPQAPLEQRWFKAYGVQTGIVEDTVLDSQTACDLAVAPALIGVFDPCCTGFLAPPAVPAIEDSCFLRPTSYNRSWVTIPKNYAPEVEDGLLSITITNDASTKRGLRVRVYPDPVEHGYAGISECDFCDEFFITYIPAGATWRLDGPNTLVTTQPAGTSAKIVSSASVRGRAGGPFQFPVTQCNTGYVVVVDTPTVYMENCGADCLGFPQGDLWVDVTMRRASM